MASRLTVIPRALTDKDGYLIDASHVLITGGNGPSGSHQVEVVDSTGTPLDYTIAAPTKPQKVIGQTAWVKSLVTANGASQVLIVGNASRVGLRIANRVGNGQADIDWAGGTVAANTGEPLAGGDVVWWDGAYAMVNTVTFILASGQIINVWEGS